MVFGEMESDFRVAICTTGLIFLVLFCSVASVANGLLLVVLYKDPSRCFRKPIVVYIAALALMDFLSGSVTGIGVIYNYILCALGKENSSSLEGTLFAAVFAGFTICTANMLALLLSCERLFAVAFPIDYRQKSTVRRGVIAVAAVVVYSLTFSLSNLAGSNWRSAPLRFHLTVTAPFLALIVVNIALVMVIRLHNRKTECLLEGSVRPSNYSGVESKRRQREKTLAVTTQLIVFCFVTSLLPYLIFKLMDLYLPEYREQDWFFAGVRFFLPFVYLNPAANPLIFNFRIAHFRRAFRLVFMSRFEPRDRHLRLKVIQFSSSERSRDI